MANRNERKLLNLLKINQIFLELRPEININLVSAFVAAAFAEPSGEGEPAPTIKELSVLAGLPYTSMSRHLRYLGDKERTGKEGLRLVEVRENPENKREKLVYLTSDGEALKNKLVNLL